MKIVVDRAPKRPEDCVFCSGYTIDGKRYTCNAFFSIERRCTLPYSGECRYFCGPEELVVRGEWLRSNPLTDTLVCSECDWNIPGEEFITNFCPNCGAKMKALDDD